MYRSRVSFIPLRISATTFPGSHVLMPACVAVGIVEKNFALFIRESSCTSALHSTPRSRALLAVPSFIAV